MRRRYWHPINVAAEITTLAQKVRVPGGDLVLSGRATVQVEAGNFILDPA